MKKTRIGVSGGRRLSMALGALVLAFGAIVLARAKTTQAAPLDGSAGRPAGPARIELQTPELSGFVAFTQSALLADGTRELFADLRLEGGAPAGEARRRPIALAIALDVSGSMMGEKIVEARRAVAQLLERMHPDDQVALVVYHHEARLLSPLRPVRDVRASLGPLVAQIEATGGTHIPGGLGLAARALDDAPEGLVRRLVLVSDGQDGSGIALTDVSREVSTRARGGTLTSALGIGVDYEERWLTSVADAGRGNYAFLAGGEELAAFLTRELHQASSTVADRAEVELTLPSGWRIAEAYGAQVPAGTGRVPLGALFAGERRRVTLRLEVPAGAAGTTEDVAVGLRYRAIVEATDRNLALGRLSVAMVADEAMVVASRDVALHAEAVASQVDAQQALAIEAWRDGRREEAERMAQENVARLQHWQAVAPAAALGQRIGEVSRDLDSIQRLEAHSGEGRAYGLQSNDARRQRGRAY